MILEKFAFALRFFTSYQRWLIWQWLLISAPFLCLVPSLIFNPTKQPYLKVCNSGICWYENGYTGIPGLWTQVLNAGLWTMDSGPWTLDSDATLWTLGSGHWTLFDCFRTETEVIFWFCLIKLPWVRISRDLMVTLVL